MDHGIKVTRANFTAVVIKEVYDDAGKEIVVYCGMALEWRLCASGKTLDECRKNLEHVLITQNMLLVEFPDSKEPEPAHEDWQRVKTSGKFMVHSDQAFARNFGYDRAEIVARWHIDLDSFVWKAVPL